MPPDLEHWPGPTSSEVSTHEADTTDIHGIQDTADLLHGGSAAGGVLAGTYPDPTFSQDLATQAELDAALDEHRSRQPINVLDEGAVGDGVADDTAAIQAAVDDAAVSGRAVYLPAGDYLITSTIVADTTVHIFGDGQRATTLLPSSSAGIHLRGSTSQRCIASSIRDLEIDGADNATGGVVISWAEHSVIERVAVRNCAGSPGHGIYADDAGTYNWLRLRDCITADNAGDGINLVTGSGFANNLEIVACRSTGNSQGLDMNGVSNRVFGGWYLNNDLFGIRMRGTGNTLFYPLVENNFESRNYPRADDTAYNLGARTKSTDTATNPWVFQAVAAGTTGTGEPAWPSVVGQTVTDGTVTWMNVGMHGEGNGDGAGIDDTDSQRCSAWLGNSTDQPVLGTGNTFELVNQSGGPGGALDIRPARSGGVGRTGGLRVRGGTSNTVLEPTRNGFDDLNLYLLPKGAGTIILDGPLDHDGSTAGFFGSAPVAKPSALTASDTSVVDSTYGVEEEAVLSNVRTRLDELESRLQSLGLLA